jgi:membrane protein DedA with SNARE-associated domain/rhodanese-related sulfurtransferase
MMSPAEFIVRHDKLALFSAVLLESLGVPLPAAPFILAAGALAGSGKLNPAMLLGAGVAAAMLGDFLWYRLGRREGGKILKLLCRISLEPDSCVGTAKSVFSRHGPRGLLLSKFVPALGGALAPLAGAFGVAAPEFLFFDGIGAFLYVGSYAALGFYFSKDLAGLSYAVARFGSASALLIAAGFAGYAAWKWARRRSFFKKLKMARITVDELRRMQEAGQDVLVFDVRSALDLKEVPYVVPGARWIPKEDFEKRQREIPRDREVVLYCACPNEASAAEIALVLRKHGLRRVRPLLGGIEAWMQRGFAVEAAAGRDDA